MFKLYSLSLKGHHLYVDMLSVKPEPSKELNIDKPKFPMGKLKPDPANPDQMREYQNQPR